LKKKDKVLNKEYQELNGISKRTATNELAELVNGLTVSNKTGTYGDGISYKLNGQ